MELRFIKRETPESWDGAGNVTVVSTTKVLQFRVPIERVNLGRTKVGTKFSEWKDVPLVEEGV